MMTQNRAETTWEINNYGRCINQFPPNIIKSQRQYERINKKICRQKMSIMFNEIYIYIYISSSSSCRAAITDIPDPLSPLLSIVHCLWQVFRATSRIFVRLKISGHIAVVFAGWYFKNLFQTAHCIIYSSYLGFFLGDNEGVLYTPQIFRLPSQLGL